MKANEGEEEKEKLREKEQQMHQSASKDFEFFLRVYKNKNPVLSEN